MTGGKEAEAVKQAMKAAIIGLGVLIAAPAWAADTPCCSVTTTAGKSTSLIGGSVIDTNPSPSYRATVTVTGKGLLSGVGWTGSGTSALALTGTLANLNKAVSAIFFTDTVAEIAVVTLTVIPSLGQQVAASAAVRVLAPPPPPPPPPISPSGTVLLFPSSGKITDAAGHVWTITSTRRIAVDGKTDVRTSNVSKLATVKGSIWQQNSAGWWWRTSGAGAAWTPINGTRTGPPGI